MSENHELNPSEMTTPANESQPEAQVTPGAQTDAQSKTKDKAKVKAKKTASKNAGETKVVKPSKNALTPQDRLKLLAAVSDLPFIHRTPKSQDYMRDVMLTVLDFHMQAEVVGKAINYFRDRVQSDHGIHTHDDLTRILATYPDTQQGNVDASLFLWNNRHWQRTHLLRGLLAFFSSIGVTDQEELRCWARHAAFDKDFHGKVKGLGLAVFQWLLIRMGVPAVKPDVWVINFAQRITGKRLADKVLVDLFHEIAPLVGQSMTNIDMTIWAFERMRLSTDDLPGLRPVWWRQVWQQLQEWIKADEAFRDGQWNVTLDALPRLRYDASGIRMSGGMIWAGETEPVETLVTLMQSGWRERFRLILTVNRDAPDGGVNAELKTCLAATGWVVSDTGLFQATLDMDVELFMPPSSSVAALMEDAGKVGGNVMRKLKTFLALTEKPVL
ncbi:MAG: hypothetical protein NTV11_10015 [Rhodocyclales bacterium]|nr:hypothetical protein [Rhodocyclales bacterium]